VLHSKIKTQKRQRIMMTLIGTLTSPFVRKVRVTLLEKKLEAEWLEQDPWQSSAFERTHNPLGKVPCLLLDGREALYDSRVIVEYLDSLSPVGKLLPGVGRERADIKLWEALADGVLDAGVALRLEQVWAGRTNTQRSKAWMNHQLLKINHGLDAMEAKLGEKAYCAGINFSLADIAVGCCLAWLSFRFPDQDWKETRPNLVRLYTKLMQRPSFVDTQPS
jgi:glutathione S-transferase